MPFRSEAQRRFMYATDPKMAKRFEKKTKKKNLPEKVAVKKQDLPDLPDWAKDLFDRKGNLKNYLPSLDEEPKEIPTPPLHPGEVGTSLDIDEHRERGDFDVVSLDEQFDPIYPSQYNQQVNLPYEYEREMTVDEVIDNSPLLRRMPRDFAEEYVKQNLFSPFGHLNTKDSRKSPFQLNLQRLTEFEDYDDWDEFEQNDDITGHVMDLPSFLNIPWNEKTAFTRSEPMDLGWRLLKEARPHALIPNFALRHMLNPKSDMQESYTRLYVPHALSNAESATEVYNQLMQEAKIREEETDYFPLPQTQIEDYGEQHPPIFRYNATNAVRYRPDFQDKLTGEPMDLAWRLLKEEM